MYIRLLSLLFNDGVLGCVVAGRLAYADPHLKVMLIEGMILSSPRDEYAHSAHHFVCRWSKQPRRPLGLYVLSLFFLFPNMLNQTNRPGIFVRNMQRDGMCVLFFRRHLSKLIRTGLVTTKRLFTLIQWRLPTCEDDRASCCRFLVYFRTI